MSAERSPRPRGHNAEGRFFPSSKPIILKFNTYPQWKKDQIINDFWKDYFDQFPDAGTMPRLNYLRSLAEKGFEIGERLSKGC